jgi:hypothetical protein
MTDQRQQLSGHIEAGDLVRLLDGELMSEERSWVLEHLQGCRECANRRPALQRQSAAISELLRSIDLVAPSVPLRVPRRTRWRAVAAIAVLAIGSLMAVPPVRAWIVTAARGMWARMVGVRAGADALPSTPVVGDEGAVSFVPGGSVLTIRMPSRAGASLTIETVWGDRVTALGIGGRAAPGVVVFPEELRLGQAPDSLSSFVVRVPVALREVDILVGRQKARTLRPGPLGERVVVPLR